MSPPLLYPRTAKPRNRPAGAVPAGTCGFIESGGSCTLRAFCADLPRCAGSHLRLAAGQCVYRQGDRVTQLYCVQSGCLKSLTVDRDGAERVREFVLPGELLGLDGLGSTERPATVVAVTDTTLRVLGMEHVNRALASQHDVAPELLVRMGRALARSHARGSDYPVDARVAAFLVDMHQRLAPDASQVELPMTRQDIGAYLGLASETVCRSLHRLAGWGYIRLARRRISYCNLPRLSRLGGSICEADPLVRAA